ncbi:monooxygenase [Prauserella shujinwangii]|uniref:Monooxygenase n=1 Tax=Prauserella shujinwangii TaxID=1453103 RepID=A0A2T0M3W6_9PSEU|nr:antibiotic biosynthesis monooxygenase family protein [Prauserella shujinwangii]PRX51427.1 monooxygenase [Prauserella shujinwangii]
MPDDTTDDVVIFVNRFTVHGPAEEFERAFARSAEFMRRQPGFLHYTLSREVGREDSYLNVAYWRDSDSLRAAARDPEFQEHVAALRALSSREHGIYAPRQTSDG